MNRRTLIWALSVAALCACGKDGREKLYEGTALGAPRKTYMVEPEAGEVHIDILSNSRYGILSDASWLTLPDSAEGRDGFTVGYGSNDAAARTAAIRVFIGDSHQDTVYLTQKGLLPALLSLSTEAATVEGSVSGTRRIGLQTNLEEGQIAVSTSFPVGTEAWIADVSLEANALTFAFTANPSDAMRSARIVLAYKSEDGTDMQNVLYVTQKTSSDGEGEPVSWAGLRAMAESGETVIDRDLVLDGIVVSNRESGNMGDPTQLSVIGLDYSTVWRTIYLESLDASCGLRILARTEEDNVFTQFDRVRISLRGMNLYRAEAAGASFYCLDGFDAYHIVSCEAGSRLEKRRRIADLTDADIFTYVELEEVELPLRKGPLTPVNELYTNASGVNKVGKFPVLVRDGEGASMYAYTNMTCPYRRDGHRLPEGSGTLGGVVVSELYSRFAWEDNASGDEDTYGCIGRYQIRHTSLEDFRMKEKMADGSFSKILAEWRYITSSNQVQYFATDGDKTAWFKHSSKNSITVYDDFSYLGPVGTTASGYFGYNPGNVNGLGVILADGTDWMAPGYTGPNSANLVKVNNTSSGMGAGISPSTIGAAWYTNVTYDGGTPQGLVVHFSTKDIATSSLSVQLAMMSVKVSTNATTGPRDYHLAWSKDGNTWHEAASFRLPDYSPASPVTQLWQTAGYMPMSFELPAAEVCGLEDVYVRIFPDEVAVVGDDTRYIVSSGIPSTNIPRTAFNYIGIRYNQ